MPDMSKTKHFKGFSVVQNGIEIKLNLDRFERQFRDAQYELDGDVMNSMEPFMPKRENNFINVTKAQSEAVQGTGKVYAAYGPQGRFLYEGKVMVDPETGSPWARKGAKKVLVSEFKGKTNVKEKMEYTKSAHPEAQSHWFDAAKAKDGKQWIKKVKGIAGGGKGG